MASYSLTDPSGNELTGVGPDTLLAVLNECTDYTVLHRDDWPERTALARRQADGWQIELTDGDLTQAARVPNTDAALDTLRSWAEEDDWWQEAFSWRPIGSAE
ncbi:MAG: hypothetical protein J2P23_15850 [Microlunatus sp.]|nr:hypothetical protein [Microlunatus sp.]